jgi:hypothetical protein
VPLNVHNHNIEVSLEGVQTAFQKSLLKEELRDVFMRYSSRASQTSDDSAGCMTKEEFVLFMNTEQLDFSESIDKLFDDTLTSGQKELSFVDFSEFIFSTNNEIVDVVLMSEVVRWSSTYRKTPWTAR